MYTDIYKRCICDIQYLHKDKVMLSKKLTSMPFFDSSFEMTPSVLTQARDHNYKAAGFM